MTETHFSFIVIIIMKKDTHPTYYDKAKITCACGNVITTGSTVEAISVELCSNCHPLYTGKQKLVDTARRVDKFQKRVSQKETTAKTRIGKKVKRAKLQKTKVAKATKKEGK